MTNLEHAQNLSLPTPFCDLALIPTTNGRLWTTADTKSRSSQGRTKGLGSSSSFLGSRTYLPDPYTTRENLIFFVLEGKLEHMKLLLNLEQVSKIIAFKNYLL